MSEQRVNEKLMIVGMATAMSVAAVACAGERTVGEPISARSSGTSPNTTTLSAGEVCIDDVTEVHYFANEAPEGSRRFGPSPSPEALADPNLAYADLVNDLCGLGDKQADPAKMVGIREYFGLETPQNADERDALIVESTQDQKVWEQKAKELITTMDGYEREIEIVTASYQTEYMIPNARPDGRPEIRKSDEYMKDKVVLKFVKKDDKGEVIEIKRLKGECDWQPTDIELPPAIPELPPEEIKPPVTTVVSSPPNTPPMTITIPSTSTPTTVGPKGPAVPPVTGGSPTTVEAPEPQPVPVPTVAPTQPTAPETQPTIVATTPSSVPAGGIDG